MSVRKRSDLNNYRIPLQLNIVLSVLISVLIACTAYGQSSQHEIQNDFLNKNISRLQVKKYFTVNNSNFHSAVQPYEFVDSALHVVKDEIFRAPKLNTSLIKSKTLIKVEPLIRSGFEGYDNSTARTELIGGVPT